MNRREFLSRGATVAAALAIAPEALAKNAGGTPIALVTADQEAHVVAVDLFKSRIVGRIATLPGPRSIETILGSSALVAHTTEGAVSLIDPTAMSVRHVIREFGQPRYTAVHPTGRYAYISDSARQEVVTLDINQHKIVHRTSVPGPARHLSHNPASPQLWTALGAKATHVALLNTDNPARPTLTRTVRPPFLAHDVVFDPSGNRAWITSGDEHAIVIYDTRDLRQVVRLAADTPPQHVSFQGKRAYVASGDDGTLRTHDSGTGRQLGEAVVPVGSYNVTFGWTRVATPSLERGTLSLLNQHGRLLTRLTVARAAHDTCIAVA